VGCQPLSRTGFQESAPRPAPTRQAKISHAFVHDSLCTAQSSTGDNAAKMVSWPWTWSLDFCF
jgi:hypothetical protein